MALIHLELNFAVEQLIAENNTRSRRALEVRAADTSSGGTRREEVRATAISSSALPVSVQLSSTSPSRNQFLLLITNLPTAAAPRRPQLFSFPAAGRGVDSSSEMLQTPPASPELVLQPSPPLRLEKAGVLLKDTSGLPRPLSWSCCDAV